MAGAAARRGLRRAAGFRAAGLRAAGLRAAGLRLTGGARRGAVRRVVVRWGAAPRVAAAARALSVRARPSNCLLSPLKRLSARSISPGAVALLTRVRTSLTVASNLFCPSLMPRSICRRRSGGIRFSAWRSAVLPAFTAWLSRDRDGVRRRAGIRNLLVSIPITQRVRIGPTMSPGPERHLIKKYANRKL